MFAVRQAKLEVPSDQPARWARRVYGGHGDAGDGKAIAEAVHGLEKAVGSRVIADRVANLAHGAGEAGVGNEHTGPDAVEQLLLRDGSRSGLNEGLEELERFRRQVHRARFPQQLSRVGVELAISKPNVHD